MTSINPDHEFRSKLIGILNSSGRRAVGGSYGTTAFNALLAVYFATFSVSLILLYAYDVRPVAYYAVIAIAAVTIFLEILLCALTARKSAVALTQIMLLSLNLIWGVTLKYYYYFGRTDVFTHVWMTESVVQSGHIAPSIFQEYTAFSSWQILSSYLSMMSPPAFPVYKVMFIASGVAYCAILASMYALGLKLFRDRRIALLSSLCTSFFSVFLVYGMYSISRSIEPLFEIFLLILLFYEMDLRKYVLVALVTVTIVTFHPVSIVFIFPVLLAIYLLRRIFLEKRERSERSFLTGAYLSMTLVFVAAYWYFPGRRVLDSVLGDLFLPQPETTLTSILIPGPELFNYLQYSLLLVVILVGFVVISNSKKYSPMAKVFALLSLVLLALSFPGPTNLLDRLAVVLNVSRFEEYSFPIIALVLTAGFITLFENSKKYLRVGICIFFAAVVLLSISNDFIASDNPLVKREFYTDFLTKDEVTAFNRLGGIANGTVLSDYITGQYLTNSPYHSNFDILQVNNQSTKFLTNTSEDVLLIRTAELSKRPLRLYNQSSGYYVVKPSWTKLSYYYSNSALWQSLAQYNKVYDSGSVGGFD